MAKTFVGNAKDRKSKREAIAKAFASRQAKQVKMDDLSQDDIIIAVLGPSGSGKSTFINTITGLEIGVGHNLESYTSEITTVRLAFPEVAHGDLVFVDTPGFDDTNKSDVDILKMIADWLKSTYAKEILLSGLLYFHRITDNRMAGTPLRTLRVFEELCGKNAFENVILVTTMWDEIDGAQGEARELELKSKYWRPMLERGSTTSRLMGTRESAFTLVDPFIEVANKRVSLLLQQEIVDMSRDLPATSAGHELYSKMEFLVRQRQKLFDRIRNDIKRADGDTMALEPLQQEHEKLRIKLDEAVNKMQELKLPLGKRLFKMAEKFFGIKFTSTFFNLMLSNNLASSDDIIIAVMGPSGSGKSTFINIITGLGTSVGHKLASSTTKVRGFRCSFPELAYGDLVFVDTPGFEFDTVNKSHVDVLKMVTNWIKLTYAKDILLSGVLYFHRITDNRLDGTPWPLKNVPEFEELCGRNAFQRVILATTMWDETDEEEGETREQELKSNYWEPMLERGSITSRFMRTRKSAFALVDPFIEVANKRISDLHQQEMSRQLPATSAEPKLYSKMESLVKQRQELLDQFRNAIKCADDDKMALEPLQRDHEKLRTNLEATINEMRELRLPLERRLVKMAEKLSVNKFNTPTFYNFMLSPDSSSDDVIIAVIGPSGSGKSTFINTIMGLETGVGHGLGSCTREVRWFGRFFPELTYDNVVLVDTPPFNDTPNNFDVDILKMVAEWLKLTYGRDILLSGVVYLHKISLNRRTVNTPFKKDLQVAEKLCGQDAFRNVIFATTMWDEVTEDEGVGREQELKSSCWGTMIERGSTTGRFLLTRESAFALVDPIIKAVNERRNMGTVGTTSDQVESTRFAEMHAEGQVD